MMKKLSLFITVFLILVTVSPALAGTKVDGNQVTFTHKAPDASVIYLSGTFNGWSPVGEKMTKGADGVWSVTIKLKPATYQYKFVVDGAWTPDPEVTATADDGNGGKNSILIVKAPGASAGGADDARLDALEAQIAALEQSQAASGFSFHGYARTGILMTDNGEHYTGEFKVPGASSKYRLGNESDTFIESVLEKKWTMDDGSYGKVHFLWCHKSYPNGEGWNPPSNKTDNDTSFFMRESYAELGNLPDLNNLTFWAGERYYRRDDIHIIDWYWRDFTGIGAGVEGIHVGDAKLAIAYMGNSTYKEGTIGESDDDYLLKNSLIFSLTDLQAGPGNLDTDLVISGENDHENKDDGDGFILTNKYSFGNFFGLSEGSSFIGAYYGKGLATYGLYAADPPDNNKNAELIKLVASGVSQITENFEIQPVLVYLKQKNDDWNLDETWTSVGCRPVYHFNKNFALQFEAGYDECEDFHGTKYTIAPTVTLDKGFWARPQLRAFVTRYDDNTSDAETVFGFQMEAWW